MTPWHIPKHELGTENLKLPQLKIKGKKSQTTTIRLDKDATTLAPYPKILTCRLKNCDQIKITCSKTKATLNKTPYTLSLCNTIAIGICWNVNPRRPWVRVQLDAALNSKHTSSTRTLSSWKVASFANSRYGIICKHYS